MFHYPQNAWHPIFEKAKKKGLFDSIESRLRYEYESNKIIFPPQNQIFRAFELCDFDNTQVVILGQDPYHGDGEANGLCFSVNEGIQTPPSLRNIFQELHLEYPHFDIRRATDLSDWAIQGILLINAILTVEKDRAASHSGFGWQDFTDFIISEISYQKEWVIFILLGNFAKSKTRLINQRKHIVLTAAHPSPLSAHRGFFKSNIFLKCNQLLEEKSMNPIRW